MNEPEATRCPFCGTVAAEVCCHICKAPRPGWICFSTGAAFKKSWEGPNEAKPDAPVV